MAKTKEQLLNILAQFQLDEKVVSAEPFGNGQFPHSKIQRESFFVDRSRTSIPAAFDGMFDYLYCLCILCIIRWDNLLFHIHTFLCRKGTKNTGYTGQNANIL